MVLPRAEAALSGQALQERRPVQIDSDWPANTEQIFLVIWGVAGKLWLLETTCVGVHRRVKGVD
jgi:hypothetical protein